MHFLRKLLTTVFTLLFPTACGAAFFVTIYKFYYSLTGFYRNGFILIALLYAIIMFMFMHMYNGTKLDTERIRNLVLSDTIALFLTNIIFYIVLSLIALKFFNPVALLISMAAQVLICTILAFLSVFALRHIFPKAKGVAISSGSAKDKETISVICNNDGKRIIEKTLAIDELYNYDKQLSGYDTVIIGDLQKEQRADLLTYCYNAGKEVMIIPSVQDILLNNSSQYVIGDKLIYVDRYVGFDPLSAFIKRAFDIIASLLGIILTSPVMAIAAILIRSYDKGPAVFKQERLTKGGRAFTIYKFRSMIMNAEKNLKGMNLLAKENDSRITPIGAFIRKTRIDELPQLFNILKGDMSIVGPRPERQELYDIYCQDFPEFKYRLKVKAGLTGYAQVYGKYNTSAEDKVKLDLLYIEKASLVQDIQLILYTIKIIFVKESTEGFKK